MTRFFRRPASAGFPLRFPGLAGAAVIAALVLASCTREQAPLCPRVAILDSASTLTAFRPGAPETDENVMFTAEVTDVKIECRYRDRALHDLEAWVTTTIDVRRGPAFQGSTADFDYFVSIADFRGTVLNKRVFNRSVAVGGGPAVRHEHESWQYHDLRKGGVGSDFETWVGFQLTDAQLEYNRRRMN